MALLDVWTGEVSRREPCFRRLLVGRGGGGSAYVLLLKLLFLPPYSEQILGQQATGHHRTYSVASRSSE